MNSSDDVLATQLQALAEHWLKRPLTADEDAELARFRASLAADGGAAGPAQAGTQAERVLEDGRRQSQAALQRVLQGAQQVSEQMAREREREDRAMLRMVESARSLAELRPSALPPAAASPGSHIVLTQIADRLANLVKAEVRASFERQLGPLVQRMEEAAEAARAAAAQRPAQGDAPAESQNPGDVPAS